MSSRTQFWLGSLMLALSVGLLVGGFVLPRQSYSQDQAGEGRSLNFAVVPSSLQGVRPRSQIIYVLDDRNEALYVIETTATEGSKWRPRDWVDLREAASGVQKERAKQDKKKEKTHEQPR